MFKKSSANYKDILNSMSVDEGSFILLKDFIQDEKYKQYMDQNVRKEQIKNTLDEVVNSQTKKLKISTK
jgi:hypothetical protein